ncbi:cytidine deaminase [Enterobacter cancerogenus]|uniref:Cytidine deaminase n=1 Tax=Enterobacter cancerogenus TaxID=69218 RepID=A0A484YGE9_9ENTR|nr:cytidine deaminase [Enterobacter cancerogenus]
MALQCRDGRIFTGSYAENAAFNPTLPPLQGALNLLSLNGYDYPDIQPRDPRRKSRCAADPVGRYRRHPEGARLLDNRPRTVGVMLTAGRNARRLLKKPLS